MMNAKAAILKIINKLTEMTAKTIRLTKAGPLLGMSLKLMTGHEQFKV